MSQKPQKWCAVRKKPVNLTGRDVISDIRTGKSREWHGIVGDRSREQLTTDLFLPSPTIMDWSLPKQCPVAATVSATGWPTIAWPRAAKSVLVTRKYQSHKAHMMLMGPHQALPTAHHPSLLAPHGWKTLPSILQSQ